MAFARTPLRLFCFPHAGGGGSFFASWSRWAPGLAVTIVEYPGRQRRIAEAPLVRLTELTDRLADDLEMLSTEPFAFFGHSMGARVAFEVARELRRRRRASPVRLVVSAAAAPGSAAGRPICHLPDDRFVATLQRLGAIPEEVIEDPELLRRAVRVLRADLSCLETHVHREEPPLSCPITAFAATEDRMAPEPCVAGWKLQTESDFTLIALPGGHFYRRRTWPALVATIAAQLARTPPGDRAAGAQG